LIAGKEENFSHLIALIEERTAEKISLFQKSLKLFNDFKEEARKLLIDIERQLADKDSRVRFGVESINDFYFRVRVGGDTLVVIMHSNIHMIPPHHYLWNSSYLRENPIRGYCSLIYLYNFLSDSFLYNREDDIGYIIARIYVNTEEHFFVEGRRQLDFLYSDFANQVFTREAMRNILINALISAISFDLYVPERNLIEETTVRAVNSIKGSSYMTTGKRLGFSIKGEKSDTQ